MYLITTQTVDTNGAPIPFTFDAAAVVASHPHHVRLGDHTGSYEVVGTRVYLASGAMPVLLASYEAVVTMLMRVNGASYKMPADLPALAPIVTVYPTRGGTVEEKFLGGDDDEDPSSLLPGDRFDFREQEWEVRTNHQARRVVDAVIVSGYAPGHLETLSYDDIGGYVDP